MMSEDFLILRSGEMIDINELGEREIFYMLIEIDEPEVLQNVARELNLYLNLIDKKESCQMRTELQVNFALDDLSTILDSIRETIIKCLGEEAMAKAGYVYIVKTTEGHYKIGESKEPKKRFSSLGGPVEKIVHSFQTDDCKRLETYLHDKFIGKRVGSEIFELSQDDLDEISVVRHIWYGDHSHIPQTLSLF